MPNYKVVDADKLEAKLSRIGNSVRGKTGKTELIPIDDIPAEIDGISSGDGAELARQIAERTVTEYSDSDITAVGNYAFHSCNKLVTVDLPEVTEVGTYAFYTCSKLNDLRIPKVKEVKAQAFRNCSALEFVDFHEIESIAANVFYGCDTLGVMVIRTPTVCTLAATSALTDTIFDIENGRIYVPAALVEEYREASNWSYFYENGTCDFYAIEGSEYE